MKVSIKRLEGKKWKTVDVESLKDHSIATYMHQAQEPLVACVSEGEFLMFISNAQEELDRYKGKALCISTEDLLHLIGEQVFDPVITKVFPDGSFEARTVRE